MRGDICGFRSEWQQHMVWDSVIHGRFEVRDVVENLECGFGRQRHVQTQHLWFQERMVTKHLSAQQNKTTHNIADILTKEAGRRRTLEWHKRTSGARSGQKELRHEHVKHNHPMFACAFSSDQAQQFSCDKLAKCKGIHEGDLQVDVCCDRLPRDIPHDLRKCRGSELFVTCIHVQKHEATSPRMLDVGQLDLGQSRLFGVRPLADLGEFACKPQKPEPYRPKPLHPKLLNLKT